MPKLFQNYICVDRSSYNIHPRCKTTTATIPAIHFDLYFQMLAFFIKQGLGGMQDNETVEDVIHNIFDSQDADGDQQVSHDEFSGPKHDEFWRQEMIIIITIINVLSTKIWRQQPLGALQNVG